MKKIKLFHFDIPTLHNYGDNLLFEAVKCSFESFSNKTTFEVVKAQNLRFFVQEKTVDFINKNCDAVLIGGGGLLLSDTNTNTNSGWQWNCSIEMLKKIQKPIVAFAIGNNRFRGQADFSDVFREHFNLFVEKSIFVGMRNHESIERTRPYLETKELQSKLTYQPCPTALISKLIPNYHYQYHTPRKEVYFQIAMDRPSSRFPEGKDVFLEKIYNSIEILSQQGWQVGILEFAGMDKDFTNFVKDRCKEFSHIKLQHKTEVLNGLNAISSLPFIIAMRGHGVMIPFGLGVPTLSLVSHDKLRYFLHDTKLQDLSVDVLEDNFQEKIVEKLNGMYDNFDSMIKRFSMAQEKIISITLNNLSNIYKSITSKQPENNSFLCKELSEIEVSIDRRNIRFYKGEVAALKRKVATRDKQVDQRNKELGIQRDKNRILEKKVRLFENSRSWKITRPLRLARKALADPKKFIKILKRRLCFVFYILPVKNTLIFFESHRGLSYSCNPKYIYEALLERKEKFTFVWSFQHPGHIVKGPAKLVKRFTIRYYYYLARAKFLIHNAEFAQNLPVRKKQIYINTQHGTPLKKMGSDMLFAPNSVKSPNYTKDGRWSFLVTPNNYTTNIFRRVFSFNGPILELGYPRNDIFYKKNNTKSTLDFKHKFGLQLSSKVILYAPTWRNNKKGKSHNNFSLKLDIEKLYNRFAKSHVLILRLHHLDSLKLGIDTKYNGFVYNFSESKYDIQELCLVSDMLITDYSSIMFDYANLNRPQIFYAYDLEYYKNELRGVYFDIEEEGPGPVVKTMDELIDAIERIDEICQEKYSKKYGAFRRRFCYLDDGMASERVIDEIITKKQ